MKTKVEMHNEIKGTLVVEKLNIITKEKETFETQNLTTVNLVPCALGGYAYNVLGLFNPGDSYSGNTYLALGSGSTEPSSNDTKLTNYSFHRICTLDRLVIENKNTAVVTMKAIFPASASYVGTLREYGIGYANEFIRTHGLFRDAEGNPIEIEKTDLDELIITYNVTITNNKERYGILGLISTGGIPPVPLRVSTSDYKPKLFWWKKFFNFHMDDQYVYFNFMADTWRYGAGYTEFVYDSSLKILKTNIARLGTDKGNGMFLFLYMTNGRSATESYGKTFCPIDRLDTPNISLTDYTIGIGDGATQDFIAPLPTWTPNTEKIYINGVEQTRNVDYTCDPYHNLQRNNELIPTAHAVIISGSKSSVSYNVPKISTIYTSAAGFKNTTDFNSIPHGYFSRVTPSEYQSELNLINGTPYIIKLPPKQDVLNVNIDTIYISTSYHDSTVDSSNYNNVTIEVSDDLSNWTTILEDVTGCPAGKSTLVFPNSKPLADWGKYTLSTPIYPAYVRISVEMVGNVGGSSNYHDRFGLIMMHEGSPIHFTNIPAQDAVITMDCDETRMWKDDQHVIDYSATFEW